jgi:predicted Zn-dependent peptidase
VLAPDEAVTDVVVHVRYPGMADDKVPGMAHLIEKLAALGTVHRKPGEHDKLVDAAGGFTTSSTTLEALSFVTQVPAEQLPLVLWLEAERMAGLADGVTAAGLAEAKQAIAGEYAAAYVTEPYARTARAVRVAMFGADGAIRRDPLGDGKSIDRVTLDEVRAAIRARIRPGRATLVIAGKLDAATAGEAVRRYLGWIPDALQREPGPPCCSPLLKLGRGTTTVVDGAPGVVVAYHLPHHSSDDLRFAVLGRMLAGAADARLVRELVDTGRCGDIRIEVSGVALEIWATPVASAEVERIAADIRATVKAAASDLSTSMSDDNVERARRTIELERLLVLENLSGRARAFASGSSAYPIEVPADAVSPILAGEFREDRAVTVIARPVKP